MRIEIGNLTEIVYEKIEKIEIQQLEQRKPNARITMKDGQVIELTGRETADYSQICSEKVIQFWYEEKED